ncbi:CDP-alcohol phosphatidyltransferase family protein [Cellulomonas rhizosphaerae]|uniref:CDP-alcohol phosphatidyltransferase family protein n=1 Tax=Cellulomonas rhizosphaerae TaxID=2293719 RepID=A0A413RN65_9CELL|nr:CDP-alcohol phosphatidyltransferase family protein [Cellulomonas rhizosphaerae]RHA43142.1 CDP-alcohol phosphatidyltransferase family protein [Cellulomonas rhizosphaerae]
MSESYSDVVRRLSGAQKGAARSAPAYSRFVNRKLGRLLAAAAYRGGVTPNGVTVISATHTYVAIALLAVLPPSDWLGIVVALLLVLGYAWDSADGQVARLTGTGSSAGEWLDHMVDSAKVVMLPLALLVGLYRAEAVDDGWLLVPLVNAVVGSVMFFGMMLTEQLRRAHGVTSTAASGGRFPWLRSVLALPTDYGVLCLAFVLYGWTAGFMVVFTLITAGSLAFVALALPKWFRDVRALAPSGAGLAS